LCQAPSAAISASASFALRAYASARGCAVGTGSTTAQAERVVLHDVAQAADVS